ncbi:MAG: nuclear transport factor 2 family protein [Ferruginibacter sp.]
MKIEILEQYKKAWENHDLSILGEIFHENIIYQEKPDSIICGLNNLEIYWQENSRKQVDVRFTINRWIAKDDSIIVDWAVQFYDKKKQQNIYLVGIMWIDIFEDKIIRLKEFFLNAQENKQ